MTEGEASKRDGLAERLLPFVLVIVPPFVLAFVPAIFNDGDTSWHVAAGRWIAARGAIPASDPFSFTAAGKPWVAMEWPADLLFAGTYGAFGYAGLAALFAAALVALHLVVFAHLRERASGVAIVVAFLLMDVALAPFMLVRPHVLVWPVLALWTALLARASETGRPPQLWAASLLTLWSNMHGSFPLAVGIGAALAFDALVEAKWTTLKHWLVFAGVSLVAMCLNLNGVAGLLQPLRVANLQTLRLIQEWQPSTIQHTPTFYAALIAGLGMLLWRGTRVPAGRLVLLLAMLALAFTQQRHQSWFVIVAALLVPPLLATRAEPAGRLALIALVAVPLVLMRALLPLTPPESAANSRAAIAAIPAELKSQPVFNEYTFGGPLILAGIKPYIDGRSEMYGDAFVSDYAWIAGGDVARFNRAVERYGIRWTMLPPRSDLVVVLDKTGQWRRIYSDKVAVIHVRKD